MMHLEKIGHCFFKFFIRNPSKSPSVVTILVWFWFIITSLVCFFSTSGNFYLEVSFNVKVILSDMKNE